MMECNEDVLTLETYKDLGYSHICVKLKKHVSKFASSLRMEFNFGELWHISHQQATVMYLHSRHCHCTLRDQMGHVGGVLLATWNWEWIGSLKCPCFVVLLTWGDPVLAALGVGRQGFWHWVRLVWNDERNSWAGQTLKDLFLFEKAHVHFWWWGQNVNRCSQCESEEKATWCKEGSII